MADEASEKRANSEDEQQAVILQNFLPEVETAIRTSARDAQDGVCIPLPEGVTDTGARRLRNLLEDKGFFVGFDEDRCLLVRWYIT